MQWTGEIEIGVRLDPSRRDMDWRPSTMGTSRPRGYLAQATAILVALPDGTFRVKLGFSEYGTGSSVGLAIIAAETLDVPVERVVLERVETDRVPDSGGTFASRTTLMGGNAVRLAAMKLRKNLEESGPEGWIGHTCQGGFSALHRTEREGRGLRKRRVHITCV